MAAAIEVRLLGPFEVRVAGHLVEVPAGRARAVLAELGLSAGRPLGVDALVERVWGDASPMNARQALQTNVWRLRRLLGAEAIVGDADGYRLDTDPALVDVLRFCQLLDQAQATGEPALARQRLDDALAMWRGEPFAGLGSETLQRDQAANLTERYLSAVQWRVDLDLSAGQGAELVAQLRALTAEHPMREPLWARLMVALCAAGRQAEALQAYEQARTVLADALGADPGPELRKLHHQVLTGDLPPANERRDEAETAARTQADATIPRQLPLDVKVLLGREKQHADLDRLLSQQGGDTACRVVVVHGPGGVGKTALAVRWAHAAAARFPDGQLFLDLRGYGPGEPMSASDALGALLRSMGVATSQAPHETSERAALWRSTVAGRRLLVVLDNAREVEQVRPLLPGSGAATVVTSRSQLRGLSVREGAGSLPLTVLDEEPGLGILSRAVGQARMAADPPAAGQLVGLCGGLPLALRITAELAARHPETSLATLVAELRDRRLEVMADPEDPATDVRAVFSWSYESLNAEEARAFRLLGLHPGEDFTVPAAAATIGVPEPRARRVLDRLAAVHLLEHPHASRYRLHDLLREYAAELVAAGESPSDREAAIRRILDWHVHTANNANTAMRLGAPSSVADPADPDLVPLEFADPAAALAWFRIELSNAVAVTRLAAETNHPLHAIQLPRVLSNMCELAQRVDAWLAMAQLGYSGSEALDAHGRYLAAYTLASALSEVGRLEEAEPYFREALRHAQLLERRAPVTTVLNSLAILDENQGRWQDAIEGYQEALRIAREHDLPFYAANYLLNLGDCEIRHGLVAAGIGHSKQALAAYRELDAGFHQAMALSSLAAGHARLDDLTAAVRHSDEAMAIHTRLDDQPAHGESLVPIAKVYRQAGHTDKARSILAKVVEAAGGQSSPVIEEARQLLAELDGSPILLSPASRHPASPT